MRLTLNRLPWLWLALTLIAESVLSWMISVYEEAHWFPWRLIVSILLALIWTVFLALVRVLAGAVLLTMAWALAGDWLIALIWAVTFVLVVATLRAADLMKSSGFSKTQAFWYLSVFSWTGLGLGWMTGTVLLFDLSKWLLNKPLL